MVDFSYKDLSIIYEDNHLLVVDKPINIPMQADQSNDIDLLTICKEYLRNTYHKPGNVYCGMVQRLDRPVGGVCVFAKTSKAASRLSDQIRRNALHKVYYAVVCGETKQHEELLDYLLKDEKENMVYVVDASVSNAKQARLTYDTLQFIENLSLVKVLLETGRSHQIRVQFSSRHLPLWGDQRYNKDAKPGQQIALWSHQLSFIHPTKQEEVTFIAKLPKGKPWNLFEVKDD